MGPLGVPVVGRPWVFYWFPVGSLEGPCGGLGDAWGTLGTPVAVPEGRREGPGRACGRIQVFLAALETTEQPLVFISF